MDKLIIEHLDSIRSLVTMALREDIGHGDVTSEAIFESNHISGALIMAKDSGIFCGSDIAKLVYQMIDEGIMTEVLTPDGSALSPGTEVMRFSGPTLSLLRGERIVLNFLQRLSGIATETSRYVRVLEGTGIRMLDTRKTIPGFRALDKYAVKIGGGQNHRMGLYDMVMIKDNHIKAAGSITAAVDKIKARHDSRYRIEVETTSIAEVREALEAKADIIMLDNMDLIEMKTAVDIIAGKAETEISGNVDLARIEELRKTGVNYISSGALTHSVKAFDLSMKFTS